jgi:hypothetical protein
MSNIAETSNPLFQVEFWPNEEKPEEIYVLVDGQRIARRGHPGTPQARTWVALDPHYRVGGDYDHFTIEYAS